MLRYLVESQHQFHEVWSVDDCQRTQRDDNDHDDYCYDSLVHSIDLLVIFYITSTRALRALLVWMLGMRVPGWLALHQR